MADEVWTPLKILKWTTDFLAAKAVEEPRLDAEVMLAEVLGIERIMLYANFERVLTRDELARFRGYVKERAAGRPAKYITGKAEFHSLPFKVDERVLIPRPETECLVDRALEILQGLGAEGAHTVVELGTGSGAVVVALASEFPGARYIATDISDDAIAVAAANAEANGVADAIEFLSGDLFDALAGKSLERAVNLIVSNPPYVRDSEMASLRREVREHEPVGALVAGPLGTEVHERILAGAGAFLASGGVLLMEMDNSQKKTLEETAAALPGYDVPVAHQDFARLWRVMEVKAL